MVGWRLFRWVLWRGILSGAILGALFLHVGLFDGAVLGAVFGIIYGIALVLLKHICFTPLRDRRRYHWSMLLVSIATTIATSLMWTSIVLNARVEVALLITLIATVTAGFFAWRLPDAGAPSATEAHPPLANAVLFYIQK